jgi:SAM-dependent methyltransferase
MKYHKNKNKNPLYYKYLLTIQGTWLKDLGIIYPQIKFHLHGVDIGSDLFPKHSNIDLRQHNITTPFPTSWEWNDSFDVIHQRLLVWGLKLPQWSQVLRNLYTILKPGGYIQLVEIEFIDPANPATLPQLQKQELMQKWSTASFGMDIDIAYKLEGLLKEANFTNVTKVQFDHGYGANARSAAQRDVSAELWVECFRSLDTKIPAGKILFLLLVLPLAVMLILIEIQVMGFRALQRMRRSFMSSWIAWRQRSRHLVMSQSSILCTHKSQYRPIYSQSDSQDYLDKTEIPNIHLQ